MEEPKGWNISLAVLTSPLRWSSRWGPCLPMTACVLPVPKTAPRSPKTTDGSTASLRGPYSSRSSDDSAWLSEGDEPEEESGGRRSIMDVSSSSSHPSSPRLQDWTSQQSSLLVSSFPSLVQRAFYVPRWRHVHTQRLLSLPYFSSCMLLGCTVGLKDSHFICAMCLTCSIFDNKVVLNLMSHHAHLVYSLFVHRLFFVYRL